MKTHLPVAGPLLAAEPLVRFDSRCVEWPRHWVIYDISSTQGVQV